MAADAGQKGQTVQPPAATAPFDVLSGLAQKIVAATALCFAFGLPAVFFQHRALGVPTSLIGAEVVVRAGVPPTILVFAVLVFVGQVMRQVRRDRGQASWLGFPLLTAGGALLLLPWFLAVFLVLLTAIFFVFWALLVAVAEAAFGLGIATDRLAAILAGVTAILAMIATPFISTHREAGAARKGVAQLPEAAPPPSSARETESFSPSMAFGWAGGMAAYVLISLHLVPWAASWYFGKLDLAWTIPRPDLLDSALLTLEVILLGSALVLAVELSDRDDRADAAHARGTRPDLALTDRALAEAAWLNWRFGKVRTQMILGSLACALTSLGFLIVHYTLTIYPALPVAFGGGRPQPALVWIKSDALPPAVLPPAPACTRTDAFLRCEVMLLPAGSGRTILITNAGGGVPAALSVRQDSILAATRP